MRIALLAFHFRPDEAVGAIRPENWANWLAEEHEVHVVTRAAGAGPGDASADAAAPYRIVRTRSRAIALIETLNAWRKRARLQRAVAQAGQARAAGGPAKVGSGVLTYRMPCLHDLWLPSAYRALQSIRPELVIATHSPYISLVTALLYCLNHPDTKLWVDFRDLWADDHKSTGLPPFSLLERYLEKRALARAEVVSTVSQGLQAALDRSLGAARTRLIYNCPGQCADAAAGAPRPAGAPLTLSYTGSLFDAWRDPAPLLQRLVALRADGRIAPDAVRFCVASNHPGSLLEVAHRLGAEGFVDFRGALPRAESIALQRQSDILVLLESPAPEARGVLTGKLFEYLATDKPILALGPDQHSEISRVLEQHGRRLSLDDLERILDGRMLLPKQQPVDYALVSRQQLLAAVRSLAAPDRDAASCCQPQ